MSDASPIVTGTTTTSKDAEVIRLRRTVEAQAAALTNLALTAQLLAEQIEELRREQHAGSRPAPPIGS